VTIEQAQIRMSEKEKTNLI